VERGQGADTEYRPAKEKQKTLAPAARDYSPHNNKAKSKMSNPKEPPSTGLHEADGQGDEPGAAPGGAAHRTAGRPEEQRTGRAHPGEQPRAKGPATTRGRVYGAGATNRDGKQGPGTDNTRQQAQLLGLEARRGRRAS